MSEIERDGFSGREMFLMREALKSGQYYETLEAWLDEPIADGGFYVAQHLAHDAERLYGQARAQDRGEVAPVSKKESRKRTPYWLPKLEAPYFAHCPDGGFEFFATLEEAEESAREMIENWKDPSEGWAEEVQDVFVGVGLQKAEEFDVLERPDESEIDEDGHDGEGNYWGGDFVKFCDYRLQDIPGTHPTQAEDRGEARAEVIATGGFDKKWVNINWLNVDDLEPGDKLYTHPAKSEGVGVPEGITVEMLDAIWQGGIDAENYDDKDYCQPLIEARIAVEEATQHPTPNQQGGEGEKDG